MKKKIIPVSRKDNLIIQELENETLVYDLNANKAICLNKTSTLIWQMCDGERDVDAVKKAVGKRLNAAVSDDLIWLALDQLKNENLIENKNEIVADFRGMSRRAVIKTVGLASVIALPVISTLIAPLAVSAVTLTCGGACICTTNGNTNPCTFTPTATCTAGCTCTRLQNGNAAGSCGV